jgi:hypothetical protein
MSVAGLEPRHRYRREARRLRSRLSGKPDELYGSLRQLSDRYDRLYPLPDRTPATPTEGFANLVRHEVCAGVLPYSNRLGLLTTAGKLGIGRFEANLIIASVQHRYMPLDGDAEPPRQRVSDRLVSLLIFLLAQTTIVLLAWLAFARA